MGIRLRLEARFSDPLQLMLVARDAIARVSTEEGAEKIYIVTGKSLVQAGRIDEAITFLKDGITKIPVDKDLFSLYQSAGELLAQAGKTDEAIDLLKDGITKIPVGKYNRYTLIEPILNLLIAKQDIKALEDFLAGSGRSCR